MGKGARNKEPRVLVIYGSESGTTRRNITRIVAKWEEQGATFKSTVMKGNEAMQKYVTLDGIAKEYDVVLVTTCSYGAGEPPANITMLFEELMNNADTLGCEPLKGMQHAVLGLGSSFYETFQNCPRMHDKFLEECGSRRLAMRGELDDNHPELLKQGDQPECKRWADDVFAALQNLPSADTPPVCTWDKPQGRITDSMSPYSTIPNSKSDRLFPYVFCAYAGAMALAYAVGNHMEVLPPWMMWV